MSEAERKKKEAERRRRSDDDGGGSIYNGADVVQSIVNTVIDSSPACDTSSVSCDVSCGCD